MAKIKAEIPWDDSTFIIWGNGKSLAYVTVEADDAEDFTKALEEGDFTVYA